MTSPTRSLRRSPPRRALHERSNSHANQISSPTLRVIGDSDAKIYASTPFPTESSQILYPNRRGRGAVFEDKVSVSEEQNPTKTQEQGLQPIKASKGKDTEISRHDGFDSKSSRTNTDPHPPSFAEKSPKVLAPAAVGKQSMIGQGADGGREKASDEITQLPSVSGSRHSEDETFLSSTHYPNLIDALSSHPIPSKSSDSSLSTAGSTGTVVKSDVRGPPPRGSYSVFPPSLRPISLNFAGSPSTPVKPTSDINHDSPIYISPVSSTSADSSVSPLSPNSPSFPTPDHHQDFAEGTSGPPAQRNSVVQYPVFRAPAASGSWAKSLTIPRRPVGMNERNVPEKWTPHLSMVQSEGTADRSSGLAGSEAPSNTSSMLVDQYSTSDDLPLPPQPAFIRSRDATGSTIRVVGERGDTISNMASGNSALLNIRPPGSRRGSTVTTGMGSKGSFLRDSIPAWARTYYAHEARNAFLSAPGTSDGPKDSRPQTQRSHSSSKISLRVFKSRSRPHEIDVRQQNRNSMAITPADPVADQTVEVKGSPRRKTSQVWSPHLWHDRRTAANRRTIFRAPSLDEEAEGKALSRRNAQIWLFALGFLFPPAWILASLIPLPPAPVLTPPVTPTSPDIAHDLEKAVGPIDQARYENARWWRKINHIMAVVGILIIAAIVSVLPPVFTPIQR
ncbi:MAG: hypothetical protein Q9187_007128 [Circinaria calcarea]